MNNPVFKPFLCFSALLFLSYLPIDLSKEKSAAEEICDNALDDDKDGLIDLNDPDCSCEIIKPVSLIPNPSFEEMNCCPDNRSQLDCAAVWIQASQATTDFIHTCGWMGWEEFPPPIPFPDGEGIMGFRDGRVRQNNISEPNWKEYAGACLLSPLLANVSYRFEFYVGFVNSMRSPPINISFFGTTDCENLPFGVGDDDFGCPTNGPNWVKLGSTRVSGGAGNQWVKASIEVTPKDNISAIAIGPDCFPVSTSVSLYYFFDNLLLDDIKSFELRIRAVSHPCQEDFTLEIPEDAGFFYQWYKDGIALIGETSPQLSKIYGEGDYQVRIQDSVSCRVSVAYTHKVPVISARVNQTICREDFYPFGDLQLNETGLYIDTFKSINNCDSIVRLNLKVLGVLADTVSAKMFEGDSYNVDVYRIKQEGDHLVQLTSSQGCDSLLLLHLEFYNIFIPNVFSPNQDGINDVFKVFGEEGLIESKELIIFDRWGTQVHRGTEWDGTYKGAFVQPGVFVYLVKLRMNDGNERQFSGSVAVLR